MTRWRWLLSWWSVCGLWCAPTIALSAETSVNIAIENYVFSPADIVVKAGTKIVFVNRDRIPHSVVGEAGDGKGFHSRDELDENEEFAIVLDRPGEFHVRCGIHSLMKVHLTVTP